MVKKEFIEIGEETDRDNYPHSAFRLLEKGWQWIEANEKLFKVDRRKPTPDDSFGQGITDDDVPF